MKWVIAPVLYFTFLSSNAQYMYVSSHQPFQVLTAAHSASHTAVWIKMENLNHPVVFKLKNGHLLRRFFASNTPDAKFIITEKSIRYRPNMAISAADTILQLILKPLPQRDLINMANTLAQIETLPNAFEKLEAVQRALENADLTCRDIIALVNCLKYDAQKVTVINGLSAVPQGCMEELKTHISKAYQTLLEE